MVNQINYHNYYDTNDEYSPPELEIKFTLPLHSLAPEIMTQAIAQAKESFVMELLRLGSISGGKASELLGINRSRLSELMYLYNISAFPLTVEDLTAEVGSALQDL
jgi:predicted HTH domain antitoxin